MDEKNIDRRFIDTYVTKIEPPPENTRPSSQEENQKKAKD